MVLLKIHHFNKSRGRQGARQRRRRGLATRGAGGALVVWATSDHGLGLGVGCGDRTLWLAGGLLSQRRGRACCFLNRGLLVL